MTKESNIVAQIRAMSLLAALGQIPEPSDADALERNNKMRDDYNSRLEQRLETARKRKLEEQQNNDEATP